MLKTQTTTETAEAPTTTAPAPVDTTMTDPMTEAAPVEPVKRSVHADARGAYERALGKVSDIDTIISEAMLQTNHLWGEEHAGVSGSTAGLILQRLQDRQGSLLATVILATAAINEASTTEELLQATQVLATVLSDLSNLMLEMSTYAAGVSEEVAQYYKDEAAKYLDLYITVFTENATLDSRLQTEEAIKRDTPIVARLQKALEDASYTD
jgi:hypothetical protein